MNINKIEIKDILGCKEVNMHFDQSHCYVVQGESKCPIRTAFATAVKLIFNPKYIHLDNASAIGRGYVRIVFTSKIKSGNDKGVGQFATSTPNNPTTTTLETPLFPTPIAPYGTEGQHDIDDIDYTPSTSQQAYQRELLRKEKRTFRDCKVTAIRRFHNNYTLIEYSIDGATTITCELSLFHAIFNIKVESILTSIEDTLEAYKGQWLRMVTTDINENWNLNQTVDNPFKKFMDLYLRDSYDMEHFLSRLTSTALLSASAWNKIYKFQLFDIFNITRYIFEYITQSEYTAFFMVYYDDNYIDIPNICVENLQFLTMRTYIQTIDGTHFYQWSDAEHTVQDLLLIAFQIALAQISKQTIIYLQNMDELAKRQTLQSAAVASINARSCGNLLHIIDYLQYIIDVCAKNKITVIIEYPGVLWGVPLDANLIKCTIDKSNNWTMKTVSDDNFEMPIVNLTADLLNNYQKTRQI